MLSLEKNQSLKLSSFILFPTLLITSISLLTLYFSNLDLPILSFQSVFTKQILFIILGLVIYYLISKIDVTYFKYPQILSVIYVGVLLLLLFTLIFGTETNGAKRWIDLGGFRLQPSEFAKISILLNTIYIMGREKYKEWVNILISLGFALPLILLIYIQPSGSVALITASLWLFSVIASSKSPIKLFVLLFITALNLIGSFMLTVAHIGWGGILPILSLVLAVLIYNRYEENQSAIIYTYIITFIMSLFVATLFPLFWNKVLKPHHRNRLENYIAQINGEEANDALKWQVDQARYTIGSGQLLGKGWGNGTQTKYGFLPEANTDFIFANFAEQKGLVGSVILLATYLYMFTQITIKSIQSKLDRYLSTLIVVILLKFVLEMFINLGTNIGIIPPTGIPLPLMSYGGTITLATFFSLGLLQSIMNSNSFIDNQHTLN